MNSEMRKLDATQMAINIMAKEWCNAITFYCMNRSEKGRAAKKEDGRLHRMSFMLNPTHFAFSLDAVKVSEFIK